MKYILEGIDNCGKSTLAKKIQNDNPEMNFKIVHCTRETKNNLPYFIELLNSKENLIFDRFHIGQWVYQTSEERKKSGWMNLMDLFSLEQVIGDMIKSNELKLIFVTATIDHCVKACKNSEDDYMMTRDYLTSLENKYRYFFNNISSIGDLVVEHHNDIKVLLDDTDFTKLPKIVGIDFDGVLCNSNFPKLGSPNYDVYNYIMKNYGDWKKVLWTSRTNGHLQEALEFCNKYFPDLHFDAINDNIEEAKNMTCNNTRKLYCNVLIDDCALQGIEALGIKTVKC